MDQLLDTAAAAIAGAQRVVVYTGAGVSKESGIPTFREPETGLWEQYDPMELATEAAFLSRPAFVWSWYEHRFGIAASAQPIHVLGDDGDVGQQRFERCDGPVPGVGPVSYTHLRAPRDS